MGGVNTIDWVLIAAWWADILHHGASSQYTFAAVHVQKVHKDVVVPAPNTIGQQRVNMI